MTRLEGCGLAAMAGAFVAVVILSMASPSGAQRGARIGEVAPDINGGPWINSEPLTMGALRGRVVFVEFWTYGCVNCQNVMPHLKEWHEHYASAGLTIVGVHTPEFLWERSLERVTAAVRERGLRYAVVQDNDSAIWRRFGAWAWPTAILVDRRGIVRYQHIGEGAYGETEAMIKTLLVEGG